MPPPPYPSPSTHPATLPASPPVIAWTGPQLESITRHTGDLLISAAAGSGKTAILAERCARLVCQSPTDPSAPPPPLHTGIEHLLVLTFTDAAAKEMRQRISAAIHRRLHDPSAMAIPPTPSELAHLRRQAAMTDRASIQTLDSFCATILRQHFHEARIDPAFTLMDEEEAGLLRDATLDDLLSRWHALSRTPTGASQTPNPTPGFWEFFDAYPNGSDLSCKKQILQVHRMLATTANPADYISRARAVYAHPAQTFDDYARHTLGGKLRIACLAAQRAREEVARYPGTQKMVAGLQGACTALQFAHESIEREGAAAWLNVRQLLHYDFPRLSTIKELDNFDDLKKRTWDKVGKDLKKLAVDFAPDPAVMQAELQRLSPHLDTLLRLAEDFSKDYAAAKQAANRLDFSDLERLTLELLASPNSTAAAEIRRRYHHVLVDEFQDINPLQFALLQAFRNPKAFDGRGNLFAVGDVKQSIYAFRLAEPQLFLDKQELARKGSQLIHLPHNFRSQPKLLATLNGIFEQLLTPEVASIHYHPEHALQPAPAASPPASTPADGRTLHGAPVELHLTVLERDEEDPANDAAHDSTAESLASLSAHEEEAAVVAQRIHSLMAEGRQIRTKTGSRPLEYRDIAILLRAMKNKAPIFARALAHRGIPVHADLSTGYFDAPEVRDTLSLLQILDNPLQDIPLGATLLSPYGNFTHDDLAEIRLAFDRKEIPFAQAVARYSSDATSAPPARSAELAQRLTQFQQKLSQWRDLIRSRPLHEALAEIFAQSKILLHLAALENPDQRCANLRMLHQRALKFGQFRKQGLHRFLRFIEDLRDQDADLGEAPVLSEASNVVRIMSIHKSKGLEFPVVIVSGLGSKLNLSSRDEGGILIHRDLGIGLPVINIESNVTYPSAASARIRAARQKSLRAEELRLLYVAMTRARDHLILTGHIAKQEKLDQQLTAFPHPPDNSHAGLPEDILLKGQTPLDWILPALGSSGLTLQIDEPLSEPQVVIATHTAQGRPAPTSPMNPAPMGERIRQLLAAEPLPHLPSPDDQVTRTIARVTGQYPFAQFATLPALRTVTELKQLTDPDEEPAAPLLTFADESAVDSAEIEQRREAARLRGIATHRILELLDFTHPDALDRQVAEFITHKQLAPDDAHRADLEGIRWFLTQSPSGQRLIQAARRRHTGDSTTHLQRELPFAWTFPSPYTASNDPADFPTIRGIIDVLLANLSLRSAEILDYKTDILWQPRLPEYRQQMHYYLQAASDILHFPVTQATLIFLAAREEIIISP